ncbi:hypothetical protein [Roseibium sp. MMSF_3412]|uniref:hypothetical protein n=1 Tax=Roseibium sp. MMSF_3412 TaxID=3046712 RepID=UPI00273D263B|nr:hypothetical protein [Roseibium sp. MMSF_3412]
MFSELPSKPQSRCSVPDVSRHNGPLVRVGAAIFFEPVTMVDTDNAGTKRGYASVGC